MSKIGQRILEEEQDQTNEEFELLNSRYELQLSKFEEERWTEERGKDLKRWWKVFSMKVQQERRKEELISINKKIDTRCEAIQGELK
jgi:hypothetical protein